MHILIDGYNFIRNSVALSPIDAMDVEKGRMALLKHLAAYKRIKGHKITVVFDAGATDNLSVSEEKSHGISVVYSKGGQTADAVMIDRVRAAKGQFIVVSSDREILQAGRKAGCGILRSDEFEQKLKEALMYESGSFKVESKDRSYVHKRWITKKKGPSKRLPKAKRRAISKLGGM